MIKSIELPVVQIRMDKRFQPRFEIRQDRVDQFRESMRDGEEILALFKSTAQEAIDVSGNKKIYIEIPEGYIND